MKKIFIFALAVFISLGTVNAKELTLETNYFSADTLTKFSNINEIVNPNTLDDIIKYIIFAVVAVIGVTISIIYIIKNKNK